MKTLVSITFLTFISYFSYSQEVISSGGDSFSSGNIQVDFTIGELAIETLTNNVQLTQGFHQGTTTTTSIEELSFSTFTVYPNPSSNWIQINADELQNGAAWVTISDLQGRVIHEEYIANIVASRISIEDLAAGTYLIQLKSDSQNFSPIIIQKQ